MSSNKLASSTNAFGLLVAGDPFAGELFLHSPVIIGISKQWLNPPVCTVTKIQSSLFITLVKFQVVGVKILL